MGKIQAPSRKATSSSWWGGIAAALQSKNLQKIASEMPIRVIPKKKQSSHAYEQAIQGQTIREYIQSQQGKMAHVDGEDESRQIPVLEVFLEAIKRLPPWEASGVTEEREAAAAVLRMVLLSTYPQNAAEACLELSKHGLLSGKDFFALRADGNQICEVRLYALARLHKGALLPGGGTPEQKKVACQIILQQYGANKSEELWEKKSELQALRKALQEKESTGVEKSEEIGVEKSEEIHILKQELKALKDQVKTLEQACTALWKEKKRTNRRTMKELVENVSELSALALEDCDKLPQWELNKMTGVKSNKSIFDMKNIVQTRVSNTKSDLKHFLKRVSFSHLSRLGKVVHRIAAIPKQLQNINSKLFSKGKSKGSKSRIRAFSDRFLKEGEKSLGSARRPSTR